MRTHRTLSLTAAPAVLALLAATPPAAQGAVLGPMVASGIGGDLHLVFPLPSPCADVDQTTGVAGGTLAFTATEPDGAGARTFTLTRADVLFSAFTVDRSCLGQSLHRSYTEVGVALARTARFVAAPTSPGVFQASIPRGDLLVFEAATVDGEMETGYKRPAQDVNATIDLLHGTVLVKAVLRTTVHVKAGCVAGTCAIDEDRSGTLTATLGGRITFQDSDHDGTPDKDDNCVLTANPDQGSVATPVLQPPPPRTLASCLSRQIGMGTVLDLCDGVILDAANDAPPVFALGRNLVSWTAQDLQGRRASATQVVTVADATAPVFTSVPGDVAASDCAPVKLGTPTATDDCGGSPVFSNDAPAKFLTGGRVVTWTAADLSGNKAAATQIVTVTDTVRPTVTCTPVSSPVIVPTTGAFFKVSAADHCTAPAIGLGSYTLGNGETVNLTLGARPGVVLVKTAPDGIRYFQVGPGQALITATDRAGNVGSATCSR